MSIEATVSCPPQGRTFSDSIASTSGTRRAVMWSAINTISRLRDVPDASPAAHRAVMDALSEVGFIVKAEHDMKEHGTAGRIDVLAHKAGFPIAIEIDDRSMRKKSIRKLLAFPGIRIGCLRGVMAPEQIDGIDYVVTIHVRPLTAAESAVRCVKRRAS